MGVSLDREPIHAALAARLTAQLGATVKTVTRRYRPPAQVDATEKPMVIVGVGSSQTATVRRGAPSIWKLHLPLFVYFDADSANQAAAPTTQFNALTKAIEDVLERQPGESQTDPTEPYVTNLGLSNVFSCRLLAIDVDEGLIDPQGVGVLVLEIDAVPK